MANQWSNDDDRLLEVLHDALRIKREMPPEFVASGKAAYVWRTIGVDLAALTYDSAWDLVESATLRSESATLRALTFVSGGLTIDLELTSEEVLGQITPPAGGTVTALADAGDLGTAVVDDLGFFVLGPVPDEPFRLICRIDSGITVLTGWVSP
jgi:hypothetical protein